RISVGTHQSGLLGHAVRPVQLHHAAAAEAPRRLLRLGRGPVRLHPLLHGNSPAGRAGDDPGTHGGTRGAQARLASARSTPELTMAPQVRPASRRYTATAPIRFGSKPMRSPRSFITTRSRMRMPRTAQNDSKS